MLSFFGSETRVCVLKVNGGWVVCLQLVRSRGGAEHLAALHRIRVVTVAVSHAAAAAAATWEPSPLAQVRDPGGACSICGQRS